MECDVAVNTEQLLRSKLCHSLSSQRIKISVAVCALAVPLKENFV